VYIGGSSTHSGVEGTGSTKPLPSTAAAGGGSGECGGRRSAREGGRFAKLLHYTYGPLCMLLAALFVPLGSEHIVLPLTSVLLEGLLQRLKLPLVRPTPSMAGSPGRLELW